jgi:hypothetical protein
MATSNLSHWRRHHCRALIVWAMVPLALFNGPTIVGCGCSGHFESACACVCSESQRMAPGEQHAPHSSQALTEESCPYCCDESAAHISKKSAEPDATRGLRPHQCTPIAMRVAEPVTPSPPAAPELNLAAMAPHINGAMLVSTSQQIRPISSWDIGPSPPPNLVVLLQRLVI